MSLTVVLRSCVNLRGKCDRLARITFRGEYRLSNIVDSAIERRNIPTTSMPQVKPNISRCFQYSAELRKFETVLDHI